MLRAFSIVGVKMTLKIWVLWTTLLSSTGLYLKWLLEQLKGSVQCPWRPDDRPQDHQKGQEKKKRSQILPIENERLYWNLTASEFLTLKNCSLWRIDTAGRVTPVIITYVVWPYNTSIQLLLLNAQTSRMKMDKAAILLGTFLPL